MCQTSYFGLLPILTTLGKIYITQRDYNGREFPTYAMYFKDTFWG